MRHSAKSRRRVGGQEADLRPAAPLLLVLSLTLTGCARYDDWAKAGATDEQFHRDRHECAREASPPHARGAEEIGMNDDLYSACLSARGYRRSTYVPPPMKDWRDWLGE